MNLNGKQVVVVGGAIGGAGAETLSSVRSPSSTVSTAEAPAPRRC